MALIASKETSGTSGSRGSKGKDANTLAYNSQRAIGKDMLKYLSGLPRLMGLNFQGIDAQNIRNLLGTTWGYDLVHSELIDVIQSSPERSRTLGFQSAEINAGMNYHNNFIIPLANSLGLSNMQPITEETSQQERTAIVQQILAAWRAQIARNEASVEVNSILANRLELLMTILPNISNLNSMLDEMLANTNPLTADHNLLQNIALLIWMNVDVPLGNIPQLPRTAEKK